MQWWYWSVNGKIEEEFVGVLRMVCVITKNTILWVYGRRRKLLIFARDVKIMSWSFDF
jgi:hypothetical protein